MRNLLASILFLAATSLSAQEPGVPPAFAYDQKAPSDIRETGVEHRGDVGGNPRPGQATQGASCSAQILSLLTSSS
jgi:hypothetical protein